MTERGSTIRSIGLISATTIGAGIFALPYVFFKAGWLTAVFYLVILGTLMVVVHLLYWRVLKVTEGRERLLGLTRNYLGRKGFALAIFSVIGGLLLALVAYLVLAGQFGKMIAPELGKGATILVFWALSSLPLILRGRRFVKLELAGGIFMGLAILLIFFSAWPFETLVLPETWNTENIFLPFGIILFSLAGWTAVEPVFDSQNQMDLKQGKRVFTGGTVLVVLIYMIFIISVFSLTSEITPNTISGLSDWPRIKLAILGFFGLFALWTSYLPIGLEIRSLVERDLKWPKFLSLGLILAVPPALVALGLNDFLEVIGLVGGIFLALQYVLIILIAKKTLAPNRGTRALLNFMVLVFGLGAIYEIYYFIIR